MTPKEGVACASRATTPCQGTRL